jgi:multicomponent Na+:H+ antiporter subunit B
MVWYVEILIFLFLVSAAVLALEVKDLLAASVITTAFSFVIAITFVILGAVDVGFTEAVVGAGVLGVFYILFLVHTTRRTLD